LFVFFNLVDQTLYFLKLWSTKIQHFFDFCKNQQKNHPKRGGFLLVKDFYGVGSGSGGGGGVGVGNTNV